MVTCQCGNLHHLNSRRMPSCFKVLDVGDISHMLCPFMMHLYLCPGPFGRFLSKGIIKASVTALGNDDYMSYNEEALAWWVNMTV